MQNEEITPEVELDENEINDIDTTTENEVVSDHEADEVDWKAEALKYKAILSRKTKQATTKVAVPTQTLQENYLTREEGILIAKGMDDENISQLKAIAKGKNISLLEAEKDPLFVSYFEKVQKEKKSEQAKLGASKGSTYKETKPEFKSGLTREEHMALWKETN
jgi:hypothetical protein